MKLSVAFGLLVASSVANAEFSAHMYIPDELPCTASATFASNVPGIPNLEHQYVDTSCMKRQKMNAGLRYCAKFANECSDQIVMIGDVPLVILTPNPDSSFYAK